MKDNKEEKNLEEVFAEFKQYCKVKNLSKSTLQFYQDCFNSLTMFIPSKEKFSNVTLNKIYDYIMFLRNERAVTVKSINTYLRGNRTFLYFAMKRDYLKEFKIEMIKTVKKLKKIYTDNELKLLLKKPVLDECNFSHYRNWVIINFLLGTGCRASILSILKLKTLT